MPSRFLAICPRARGGDVMARPTEYGGAYGADPAVAARGADVVARDSERTPSRCPGGRRPPGGAPAARRHPARFRVGDDHARLRRRAPSGAKLRHLVGVGEGRALAGRGRRDEGHDAFPTVGVRKTILARVYRP